jgi:medium-chain acyl-[acyl-carrier-protein] hydrolase
MSLTPFLRREPNASARLRLFCAAHAGGGTALYAPWRRSVPDWLDVCPLQLPAREGRFTEPARTDLVALSSEMAVELAPHLEFPFALLGYSLGGLLSFEFARRLREQQLPQPVRLIVAAARAPQRLRAFATLLQLNDEAFLAELGRRYGGMRPEVWENEQLRAQILPSLRGDFHMLEKYQYAPAPPLEIPISAFAGVDDHVAGPADVEPWRDQTTADFTMHTLPGGHFFFQTAGEQFLSQVIDELALSLG